MTHVVEGGGGSGAEAGAVLHVVAAGEIGGAERMLVDLASDARAGTASSSLARRHTVALFTPNDRLRALFSDAGIEVDDRGPSVREGPLPFLASSFGRADVRWLAETIERRHAAIVHLHTFASQVLGTRAAIRARARARIVRTEHSTRVYEDPSCWPFSRWSLARADTVVCISQHVKRAVLRRAPWADAKTEVVYNGVDTDRFAAQLGEDSNDDREKPRRVRFVALGRLDARKGLDLALHAIARVPNAELDIVGDGDERASLEELSRRLGLDDRVRFLGYAGDVREAIAKSDVALSSAREEGLGIALLEAMSVGRPVVGVPIGGVVEIVREGDTGWLADVRTADALARAMQSAIERGVEERQRRGAQARERVLEHFSLHAMRRGYEQVYKRLTP